MKANELIENDIRGKSAVPEKYPVLYHLTNYQGFAYTISQNSLKAFRYPYVSTTYDKNINAVGGRDHYNLKFILDGSTLIETYGGHHYKSYAKYTDGSGKHWYDEKEIGVDTKEIEPFERYCTGLVFLRKIYSRTFVQDMFYPVNETHNFMGGLNSSAAPIGAAMLRKFLVDWKKPIFVQEGSTIRSLTNVEMDFIVSCFKLIKKDIPFNKALKYLISKYENQIEDNDLDKNMMSTDRIKSYNNLVKIVNKLNSILTTKPIAKLSQKVLENFITKILNQLPDAKQLLDYLKENNLIDTIIPPVRWKGLFKDIIDKDNSGIKYNLEEIKNLVDRKDLMMLSKYTTHSKAWEEKEL